MIDSVKLKGANMKKKAKDTTATIKIWVQRAITLVISVSIALVGMSLLRFITLPDVVIKFVGYLLILAAGVYIFKKLK